MTNEASAADISGANQRGLVKNTLYLTVAQAITIPLSVLSNAVVGRYLGPAAFGALYLASTLCSFAIMTLEWGLQGSLPAMVARDRAKAGTYLGTSLVWRAASAIVISGALALACYLLRYDAAVCWAVALSFPLSILNSIGASFKDTIRGFERTDIPAYTHVVQQFGTVLVMVPVLMWGGELRAMLLSYIAVAAATVLYLKTTLRPVGVGALRFDRSVVKPMFSMGTPFFFFGLAMVLAPNIDATYLSKLAPPEVTGWFGVSQRLIGLVIFPASALIGALYPTLCRLHVEDKREFVNVTRGALYGVALFAVPAALGCALFPELGVAIFGSDKFGGSAVNLRVMSLFVFLVYFSMPLGTCVLAADKHRVWTLVQCICVVVSVFANPFTIPYFQRVYGNGGLGPCVGIICSELLVVASGIALSPRGLFDRGLVKTLVLLGVSGGVMAGLAWLTKPVSLFLAVPLALLGYGVCAWFSGAVQPTTVDMVKGFVSRKLSRAR